MDVTKRIFELFRLRETGPIWFRKVRIDLTKIGVQRRRHKRQIYFIKQVKKFMGLKKREKEP